MATSQITPADLKAGLQIIQAVADTIREAGVVPSGTLYAAINHRVGLDAYNSILRTLKNAGLVEEKSFQLRWIGPEVA